MKKQTVVILIIFCFSLTVKAGQKLPGYIITANNDTVQCNVEVGNNIKRFAPTYRITVIDSAENETTYKSKQKTIKGFRFILEGKPYDYLSLESEDKKEPPFALRAGDGKYLTLYTYTIAVHYGTTSSTETYYVLEKKSGEKLVVTNNVFGSPKRKLREFFSNDPQFLQLVESTVGRAPDIISFVEQANNLTEGTH